MPKYRVTVHVSGLSGESPRAVRSEIDEQLRKSGLQNCQVVSIDLDAPTVPRRRSNEDVDTPPTASSAGGLLLIAAATWALLFFWWMLSVPPE